jgi:hypothetical protein
MSRNNVIDRTATGIEADTVRPTLSTKYIDDAPKTMPSKAPIMIGNHVNSGMFSWSGTNGLNSGCGADDIVRNSLAWFGVGYHNIIA